MRKVFLILSVMLLSLASVFAVQQMSVTWEWLLDDPDVNYYRYQLNSTSANGWTVVPGTTGIYTADGLDPYADYTLYLQRSYDGVNWSATASATASALLSYEVSEVEPIEEPIFEELIPVEPVEETVPPVEELPLIEVEEEPVVEEEVVEEEPAEVVEEVVVAPIAPEAVEEKKGEFEFSFLVRPYATINFNYGESDKIDNYGIGLGISFDFDNIAAFSENSGFGIRWDIGTTQYAKGGFDALLTNDRTVPAYQFWSWKWADLFNFVDNYANEVNTTLLLTIDARAGFADFSFGLGGGVSMLFDDRAPGAGPAYYHEEGAAFDFGNEHFSLVPYAAANFGMKFYMGSVFSLGVDGVYKVMIPSYTHNSLEASVVLGFTF